MSIISRSAVALEDTWNLALLYDSLEAWNADYAALEAELEGLAAYKGELCSSAAELAKGLRFFLSLSRRAEKIFQYAKLLSDTDTASSQDFGRLQQALNLFSRLSTASSFINPEIVSLAPQTLEEFLAEPVLADLKRYIRDIARFRQHTLSEAEERLLAMGFEVFHAPHNAFSQLNNADLSFGEVEVDGAKIPLSHASYTMLLKNPSRQVREEVFTKYYSQFDQYQHVISALLAGSVQKDVFFAQARSFDSACAAALFPDEVPVEVYDHLIDSVHGGLEVLHRYYELRRRLLGLAELRIFDTYVPLVPKAERRTSYNEAVELITASLAPLGEEYTSILQRGLSTERWVDRYENKGKASGAYSAGCYDSVPYILLNYKENDIRDLFTLAHEAGHSLHSYFSAQTQPYQDYSYTIFVAEVASTFNEQLLLQHLKHRFADDPLFRAFLVNQQLDDLKATFFRQTMFAEFELLIHQELEANKPLTVDVFRSIYRSLLSAYFGSAVELSEFDELECLRIPHFYHAFYVYKYATGIAAAVSLSQQVLSASPEAIERYLRFLRSGASKPPLELLCDAGVDLKNGSAIQQTVMLFASLVDELEQLLK